MKSHVCLQDRLEIQAGMSSMSGLTCKRMSRYELGQAWKLRPAWKLMPVRTHVGSHVKGPLVSNRSQPPEQAFL